MSRHKKTDKKAVRNI